ncbi:GntR family transcriptional regulator [Scopulibacillus daqui]|uniref:GntR family transcriptional regulator n=1 Tax=Scopulibacillus daqui TaxID=1469162 RepID=A0ABS2PVS4_9BACL|nr:GntR family transcriptional regulator [Scopulibacillus daqui]MBM7644148.1 GntR family transcriptional regulator [Scopulibacillus daqui]
MKKELDHTSVIPLYHQLKEILRENIESSQWRPGELIPSENQLQKEYKISRNTVKKALDDLVAEGLLHRIQGKGTFVAKPKLDQSLSSFYSFSKVMEAKGLEPKDIIISINTTEADPNISEHLNLPEGASVITLERLRCAREEPIILETSYIPQNIIPELDKEKIQKYSLYEYMQKEYGVIVTNAKEMFEPVLIREYESQYLQVKPGYPALLLDRIGYDTDRRPVEFCRSIVRGDRCRFYTELL